MAFIKHNFVDGEILYAEPLNEIEDELVNKTDKHLLTYDGTRILDGDTQITFSGLYDLLMTSPSFVVLVYQNFAYHPNGVSTEQIVFSSSYPVNGLDVNHRITMLKNGTITKTDATDENVINKTNVINNLNKDSEIKYPSLKAVADYVDPIGTDITQLKSDLNAKYVWFDSEGYLQIGA